MDNASNNAAMLDQLKLYQVDDVMLGPTSRVFCILHILNLVCKVRIISLNVLIHSLIYGRLS